METKKRTANAWVQAVKLYNAQKGDGRYTIPRKPKDGEQPSASYLAVRELMNKVSRPADAPKATPAAATVARGTPRAPRKALPVVAEVAEVAVSAGPVRKVRKAKAASPAPVVAAAPDAPAPSEAPAAPKRGRRSKVSLANVGSPHSLSESDLA